jgi:hypothetical protein
MNKLKILKNKMCKAAEDRIVYHKKERWSLELGGHSTDEVDVLIYKLEIGLQEVKSGLRDVELKGLSG